jgi:hypothetical protein
MIDIWLSVSVGSTFPSLPSTPFWALLSWGIKWHCAGIPCLSYHMGACNRTSIHVLTSPLLSSTLLYSTLLSHTYPCSYVHSPTLCTTTRCQTLKSDDSQTSMTSTCKLVDYYCHWHSTFPLCSYLRSFGQASDTLGQVYVILWHSLLSQGCLFLGGLVLGGLVL